MYMRLQSDIALSAVSKRLRRAKGACLRRLHNLVTLHTSKGQENHLSREKENAGIVSHYKYYYSAICITTLGSAACATVILLFS
jgi:hypothetical protein